MGGLSLTGGGTIEEDEPTRKLGLPEWTDRARLDNATRSMTTDEIIKGSAFHLSTGERQPGEPAFTAWGRFATGGFETEEDDVTMDGNVTTGLLGADAEWNRLLAGIMVSQSAGEGSYRLSPDKGDDEGTVESTMTGVYPYARIDLNDRVSAWGLVGVGSGELTLRQKGEDPMETDLGMRMGALGVKGQVLDGSNPSGIGVNVKSDAMWVRTTSERTEGMMGAEGQVSRLRLILQGERQFAMEGGGTFVPSGEVGVRVDGGDAETGDRTRARSRDALCPGSHHHRGSGARARRPRRVGVQGMGRGAGPSGLHRARPVEGSPCPSPRCGGAQGAKPSGSGPRGTRANSKSDRTVRQGSRPNSALGSACPEHEASSHPIRA